MAIADYLRKLVELRNQLVANLKSMGVTADESEKLNTLVPKVLQCETVQNVEFVEGTDFTGNDNKSGLVSAISKVNIPDGTTAIGDYAFYVCSSLASITIPDSVTSIGNSTFYDCTNLASITIGNGVTSIGNQAFRSCTSLASITIPDSMTTIEYAAFFGCTSLASITIPDSMTSIGNSTFYDCTNLASITIGNGVTSIGNEVFWNCINLSNIYYTGTQSQWNAITKGTKWNYNMGSNVSGGTVIHYNYTG